MASENNINNRYGAIIPKTIFHYTSFEKFKCILQYGTWRFKLSTQSNDLLDTTYIVDIIKKLEIQCKNIATNNPQPTSYGSHLMDVNNSIRRV